MNSSGQLIPPGRRHPIPTIATKGEVEEEEGVLSVATGIVVSDDFLLLAHKKEPQQGRKRWRGESGFCFVEQKQIWIKTRRNSILERWAWVWQRTLACFWVYVDCLSDTVQTMLLLGRVNHINSLCIK